MIDLLALVFRAFLSRRVVAEAREQAERGIVGRMEGHAEMDMSAQQEGPLWRRLASPQGFTATANYFVMDWAAIWVDIVGGLLIAGALAARVPHSWWQAIFLESHERDAKVVEASVTLNYTTVLNALFLALAAVLLWRYFSRGGGLAMLKMMNRPMAHEHEHAHGHP